MLTLPKSKARICPAYFISPHGRFIATVQTTIGERKSHGATLDEAKQKLARELSGMGQSRFKPDQLYQPVAGYRACWLEIEVTL